MKGVARISELRLTAFKSFVDQVMPLSPLTLLVGANGSGKSNALDGLSLLALLADERAVVDLDRDDLEVAGLRGGLPGAAPFGQPRAALGCSVALDDVAYHLDLVLDVQSGRIASEQLRVDDGSRPTRVLLDAAVSAADQDLTDVSVYSGGAPSHVPMLASRLATSQAITKVQATSAARRQVVEAAQTTVSALRGVFALDPVPGRMRGYPRISAPPDRLGEATSALVYRLRDLDGAWERLTELMRGLVGERLVNLDFALGALPNGSPSEVRVALRERLGTREEVVPAALLSDGTAALPGKLLQPC